MLAFPLIYIFGADFVTLSKTKSLTLRVRDGTAPRIGTVGRSRTLQVMWWAESAGTGTLPAAMAALRSEESQMSDSDSTVSA